MVSYSELSSRYAGNERCLRSVVRRYLLGIAIAIGVGVTFVYSTLPTNQDFLRQHQEFRIPEIINISASPQWTWVCDKGRCRRQQSTEDRGRQSLITCNVACSPDVLLWPKPTGETKLGNTFVPISTSISLDTIDSPSIDVTLHIQDAFTLMGRDISKRNSPNHSSDETIETYKILVHVKVKTDKDPKLRLDTDESYALVLRPAEVGKVLEVNLTASSFCGIRHGFETLSQLIWFDPYENTLLSLKSATIQDAPSYPYRGLLLDTARNYYPVDDILRTIDAMSASKLNTFHWHATDSQSFPLKLNSTLKFAKYGAYSSTAVYSVDDVQRIVRHARLRGIRVLIEIDAPAHIGSAWSWGPNERLGELGVCINKEPWDSYCGEPPCGQLNPANPHVYDLLQNIYAEIIELTGVTDVFHLGGDEVCVRCWIENLPGCPNCNLMKIWLHFMKEAYKTLAKANGGAAPSLTLIWSSHITSRPYLEQLKDFGIQIWGGTESPDMSIVDEGFHTVLSNSDHWYFDCGFGGWRDDSFGHCGNYIAWPKVYEHFMQKKWNAKGGEACMWSEQVDPSDLDVRVWPRGAAFAERLWTNPVNASKGEVALRLDTQRSRLIARGIKAAPLWPRWCTENPYECNVM